MKQTKPSLRSFPQPVELHVPVATPGTKRIRAHMVDQVRSEMEHFYKRAHLAELLLLNDALLMADSERSVTNKGDDCALGNAIAECFGIDALGPVERSAA